MMLITNIFYVILHTPATRYPSQQLVGTWEVQFLPGKGEDPSYTTLVIEEVATNTFSGTFYYSEMGECRLIRRQDTWYLAFITEDNSGYYASSARLTGDQLEGTTHAIGRDFLSVWKANKK